MDFIIGGLAGVGATIFTNPMDVVKTRLQLQGELKSRSETITRYRGIFHAMFVIAKNDGVLALQKGLAPAVVLGFTINSVRLGMYHVSEVQGWTKSKSGDISVNKAMFWSCVSGVMSGVIANPMLVLKTRIQATAHPSIAVGRQYRYKGMMDGMVTIYRSEGVRGYCAGLTVTCARFGIGSAVQLTTFSKVKEEIKSRGFYEDSPVIRAAIASLVSSVLNIIVETPLDVVNTRLYNQGSGSKEGLLYKGAFDCLSKIYKKEGLHGLYKGMGPLYLRFAPHTTLSLVIWDMLNNLLIPDKSKSNNKHS